MMFFFQFSGVSGSGKSTLAREISKWTGAIVIDHDVTKSALLESTSSGLDFDTAGRVAYDVDWSLVSFQLSLGRSVILDSPCLYDIMLTRGISIASQYRATYRYIECLLSYEETHHRLCMRNGLPSQISHIQEHEFRQFVSRSKRPYELEIKQVDTREPLHTYIDSVLHYLNERQART